MTREEQIDWLCRLRSLLVPMAMPKEFRPKFSQAISDAIKALEQEPCSDAISRQAVLEYIEGSWAELGHGSENELVCQDIKELPPVISQPKWIPVSERLPEDNGLYLVYTEEQPFVCSFKDGEFFIDEVFAWMPLPEPYKAESEHIGDTE